MSSAKPSPQASSLQSTRQMLDELDALMDRMLALPVNDLDDPGLPPRPAARMPLVSATLTVLEPPTDIADAATAEEPPAAAEPLPGYTTDLAAPWGEQDATPPPAIAKPDAIPEAMMPPSIMQLPVSTTPLPQRVNHVRTATLLLISGCLLPIVWLNQGFDKVTTLLGWRGAWLRGPRGRRFLGVTGAALLALAGLWLLSDWLAWAW